MERLQLEVKLRAPGGKGAARKLRAQGRVPAVVYGGGIETQALEVEAAKLAAILRQGSNQIVDLRGSDGFADLLVLLKQVEIDPVSRKPLHCDFYVVDTEQRIEVDVPVLMAGKARGVEVGGILELVLREVEVRCLPLAIPESLSIDVSGLEIGQALHVSDLEAPEGVEILADPTLTLVHVIAPRIEEEPEAPEAEVEAEAEAAEGEPAEASAETPAEESSGD